MKELYDICIKYMEGKDKNIQDPMKYLSFFGIKKMKNIIKEANGKNIKFEPLKGESHSMSYSYF